MNHDSYSDTLIRGILNTVKSIAMIGASVNEIRPSYFAFKYLLERGFHMIPVNPGHCGKELLGQRIYARLADTSPSTWSTSSGPRDMRWASCKKRSDSIRGRK
jgi:predicted CoA-binding protein